VRKGDKDAARGRRVSVLPTAEQRSKVIERLTAVVICQQYFHRPLWPFLVEVLYDENLNPRRT
jgi:hypothetical protein